MKIVHIPDTPLGECFYDPDSHKGLVCIDAIVACLTMNQDYIPGEQDQIQEIDVDPYIFRELINASLKQKLSVLEVRRQLGL